MCAIILKGSFERNLAKKVRLLPKIWIEPVKKLPDGCPENDQKENNNKP
jgi:hypothetical protein